MREIDDARESLSRIENHVARMRWIIQNPSVLEAIVVAVCSEFDREDERGIELVRRIDEARKLPSGADQWPQRTMDQMLQRRRGFGPWEPNQIEHEPRRGWQCDNLACECYDQQRQRLHYGPRPQKTGTPAYVRTGIGA